MTDKEKFELCRRCQRFHCEDCGIQQSLKTRLSDLWKPVLTKEQISKELQRRKLILYTVLIPHRV